MKELFNCLKELFKKKVVIVPTIHTFLWNFEEETIKEYEQIIKENNKTIYFESDLSDPFLNQNILDVYLQSYARSLGRKIKFLDTPETIAIVNGGVSILSKIPINNESNVKLKREERKCCFWILRDSEGAKEKYSKACKDFAESNKDFEEEIKRTNEMILNRDKKWKKPNEDCIVFCGLMHLDNF